MAWEITEVSEGLPPAPLNPQADIFVAVNASTVELVDLEGYSAATVGERVLLMWNLELDTLRADLGGWAWGWRWGAKGEA